MEVSLVAPVTTTVTRSLDMMSKKRPAMLLEGFFVFEILCQLALLSHSINQVRIFVRLAVFGSSLLMLVFIPRRYRGSYYPPAKMAIWVMVIVALSLLNPGYNSLLAALAQSAMYAAILAPLFWVPRLRVEMPTIRRVLMIIWVFQTVSAMVGIVQVYFPGHFQFAISSKALSEFGFLRGLGYKNGFGHLVLRPSGLTDVPGGAAFAGLLSAMLGMYFAVSDHRKWMQIAAPVTIFIGFAVVYLSMIKATLVMMVISSVCFIFLFGLYSQRARNLAGKRRRNNKMRMVAVVFAGVVAVVVGFSWAASVGGSKVSGSARSLIDQDFGKLYYGERGRFLETTWNTLLPEYPLGAGLGRWGMMYAYFGDPGNADSPIIWAEIQWTGWLLDGGVPLVLVYTALLVQTIWFAFKVATRSSTGAPALFAVLMCAYGVGVLALTFDYPFFMSEGAIEFWVLNAMLSAVLFTQERRLGRSQALPR